MPIIRYKPIGITCGNLVNSLKKEFNEKSITYAGRLDPMAHGDIYFLVGKEESTKKKYYLDLDKTYIIEILFGISTITDDILGTIEKTCNAYNVGDNEYECDSTKIMLNKFTKCFNTYENKHEYDQSYHRYSSFKPKLQYDGKRYQLWWWSKLEEKENKKYITEKCSKKVTIHNKKILNYEIVLGKTIKTNILNNLTKLKDSIIKNTDDKNVFDLNKNISQWTDYKFKKKYVKVRIELNVSSGFYVRQFIRDISSSVNIPILVMDIFRTKTYKFDKDTK